ncbi:MAG: chemotaxis protein CheC [Candidatus Lokiarchaeota archaeon]|nr:chemotaxis protein CheC [Candidatus Lokiarchaeota archaeon]
MNNDYKNSEGFQLIPEQLDMLKEIGNIGSGHAITALSKLLNYEIDVSLTSAEIIPFWKVIEFFDNPYVEVFGIYSEILLNSDLSIIQIFTKESIINLINILNDGVDLSIEDIRINDDLDDLSLSIISEIGNILSGHYVNALADLLSIKIVPKVPIVALDTMNAMLNEIIAKHSQKSDYLVLINTKLTVKDIKVNCIICFIPSLNILNNLFNILKIKYDMNL